MQVSRVQSFGRDGVNFPDARLIHASIRISSCSPGDDLLEVMVGNRFVPGGRGVRIPSGDTTNPAVFGHPAHPLDCSNVVLVTEAPILD